jgi:hypothetical protein
MENPKNKKEKLLGHKKLTPNQIFNLPLEEKKKYIRGLTAKEAGDLFMDDFVDD